MSENTTVPTLETTALCARLRGQAKNGGWTNDVHTLALLDEIDRLLALSGGREAGIEEDALEPGQLRPCPFCGGEAEIIEFDDADDENFGGSAIQCKKCGSAGPIHFDRKEHLENSWNDRALSHSPAANGWRPINEAPKDGRPFWLAVPNEDEAIKGWWWASEKCFCDDGGTKVEPYAWMPYVVPDLPPPPSEQREGA